MALHWWLQSALSLSKTAVCTNLDFQLRQLGQASPPQAPRAERLAPSGPYLGPQASLPSPWLHHRRGAQLTLPEHRLGPMQVLNLELLPKSCNRPPRVGDRQGAHR